MTNGYLSSTQTKSKSFQIGKIKEYQICKLERICFSKCSYICSGLRFYAFNILRLLHFSCKCENVKDVKSQSATVYLNSFSSFISNYMPSFTIIRVQSAYINSISHILFKYRSLISCASILIIPSPSC